MAIVDNGRYFLYRHIRLDKNLPFYIGVGTRKESKTNKPSRIYQRAYESNSRSKAWKIIAGKSEYLIEILVESDDKNFVHKKETEFIRTYGRIDLGTGTLCNFTDGGEGLLNVSDEMKEKRAETKKKTGSFYRNKEHLKKYRLLKGQKADWSAKKCYLYNSITGEFISDFRSATECGIFVGINAATSNKLCRDNLKYKFWVFSYNYHGTYINVENFLERKHLANKVVQYSLGTGEVVKVWKSAAEAAKSFGLHFGAVAHAINSGNTSAGYKWGIYDVITNTNTPVKKHIWKSWKPVLKIDKNSGGILMEYKSISDASKDIKVSLPAVFNAIKKGYICGGYKWSYK